MNPYDPLGYERSPLGFKRKLLADLNEIRMVLGEPLLSEADVGEMVRVHRAADRGVDQLKMLASPRGSLT